MKKLILICLLIVSAFAANAQNADDIAIAAKVENLNNAIFANKDITALETLLAKEITYGHSGGKVENRAEMIKGVMDDTKTYSDVKTEVGSILFNGKSVVVRHIISATQKEKDGKISPLKLQVLQVWVKEKKAWKLWARQAVKLTA
ncbi:MAG: nuclear transport factor 2 family protein [Deinococcales bacterium]|nr:nuclear transport factor 2 family protein [Chitinophagaceae bacterium]